MYTHYYSMDFSILYVSIFCTLGYGFNVQYSLLFSAHEHSMHFSIIYLRILYMFIFWTLLLCTRQYSPYFIILCISLFTVRFSVIHSSVHLIFSHEEQNSKIINHSFCSWINYKLMLLLFFSFLPKTVCSKPPGLLQNMLCGKALEIDHIVYMFTLPPPPPI